MKNLKLKIKIILTMLVLALGFSFCFNLVSVNAEEVEETTTEVTKEVVGKYTYNPNDENYTIFTLYSDNTFIVEIYNNDNTLRTSRTGEYTEEDDLIEFSVGVDSNFTFKTDGDKLIPFTYFYENALDKDKEETKTVDPNSFLSHLKDFKWEDAEAVITFIASYFGVDLIFKIILSVIIVLFKLKKEEQLKVSKEALVMSEIEHQQKVEKLETDYTNTLTEIKNEVKEFIASQTDKIVALSNDKTKAIAEEVKQVTELLK